jgi:hypothetical protein
MQFGTPVIQVGEISTISIPNQGMLTILLGWRIVCLLFDHLTNAGLNRKSMAWCWPVGPDAVAETAAIRDNQTIFQKISGQQYFVSKVLLCKYLVPVAELKTQPEAPTSGSLLARRA